MDRTSDQPATFLAPTSLPAGLSLPNALPPLPTFYFVFTAPTLVERVRPTIVGEASERHGFVFSKGSGSWF